MADNRYLGLKKGQFGMGTEILTFLSLGSNLGDRMLNLDNAEKLLEERIGSVKAVSRTFESVSWGYAS
ncbi:MAG: hypothetical protein KAT15_12690, partial [Bacteroidales bacterium]|nr:hypothetical protein [Bacteroidales bacterium]